jgi:hypothetical protein
MATTTTGGPPRSRRDERAMYTKDKQGAIPVPSLGDCHG